MIKQYLKKASLPKPCIRRKATSLIKEDTLVEGLRNRQPWAFSYLYDHYAPNLLGFLVKMVKDQQRAEDLLQDTFLKVYRSISQYDPAKSRFSTWLLRLTRNTALDHIRDRSRHHFISVKPEQVDQTCFVVPTYCDSSVEELVHTCLKEKHQLVIDLVYFQGYTHEEVADYLQIPLGTVKTRIRKGLQLLKNMLSNDQRINQTARLVA